MEHRLDGELGHRCCVLTRCEGVFCGVAWGYWVLNTRLMKLLSSPPTSKPLLRTW